MHRRSPVYSAVDPSIFSIGLQPDVHPGLRVLWDRAENVTFAAGRVKRRLPASLIHQLDPRFAIRGLSQQQATNGTRWLWSAFADVAYRWYGPAPEFILGLPLAGNRDETSTAPATFFDFTHYGDWTIINRGLDAPRIHKPDSGVTNFGNAPINVVRFMKKLNFMLAIGYGDRGTRVGWSDADNIEEWTASKTTLAGSISFDDFNTRIKCAVPLGSAIAVYGEDQMGLLTYIGSPFYFGQKTVLDGIGASGKFSVCSDGNSNYGVGRGGIWWTDGNSYKYIDEGFLHDYLQDNVNWNQQSKITACRNDYTGCMEFSFPMGLSLEPSEAWSYDPRTGGWSPIPAFALKDERRLFGKPIVGTSSGQVMRDQDNADASAPLVLLTKPILPGQDAISPHIVYRIDEIILLLHKAEGIQMRLGASQDILNNYTWGPWTSVTQGANTILIGEEPADGVYFRLEFRSAQTNWQLDLQGFMLFGTVDGTKRD